MNVSLEVDVALARPPRVDATVRVLVTVDVSAVPSSRELDRADVEARELALLIAGSDKRVVMPIAARIVEVEL